MRARAARGRAARLRPPGGLARAPRGRQARARGRGAVGRRRRWPMTTRRGYVVFKCDRAPACTHEVAMALEWIDEVRAGYLRGLGWERRGKGWRCPACVKAEKREPPGRGREWGGGGGAEETRRHGRSRA